MNAADAEAPTPDGGRVLPEGGVHGDGGGDGGGRVLPEDGGGVHGDGGGDGGGDLSGEDARGCLLFVRIRKINYI